MIRRHSLLRRSLAVLYLLLVCLFSASDSLQAQETDRFQNPLFPGFYPDPSITRVGEDYYLIHSTFSYFPGVPIFHSKDLVNWTQIGNILNRPEQLDLDGLGVSRGIFAPTISYNAGTFYMVTTLVDNGGNFVVTATDPAGPWSNPVWLPQVNGIDPSLFFDENGKAYIIYNSEAPNNEPLYEGHRSIRMYAFDANDLKTVGEEHLLVNGGVDISKKPVWIEGPHIYKKDGYYYLMAAEGGTSVNHSEVILRSKAITGPYEPYADNPILTQRHLPADRKNPISATGHADLVQTQNGEWWAVFLATRPYDEKDSYNIGRETFLAPVSWEGGWPIINPDYEKVQFRYQRPNLPAGERPAFPLNGNFAYTEEFKETKLPRYWLFLRTPRSKWYSLDSEKGQLKLELRPETLSGKGNPSFIARRQQHIKGSAGTKMIFEPSAPNEFAGLVIFQNEDHYYSIGKTKTASGAEVVQLRKAVKKGDGADATVVLAEKKLTKKEDGQPLFLKIEFNGADLDFYYSTKGEKSWELLQKNVDGTYLSTRVAGGFVGATVGIYATSGGNASDGEAKFDWFTYKGNDAVYEQAANETTGSKEK